VGKSSNSWEQWRRDLLANVRGRVLELGVRTGPNFRYYAPETRVIATDVSRAHFRKAKQALRSAGKAPTLGLADAQHLPFADGTFDSVVETLVFCSIPDPALALAEIARVLKPGGRFYGMDHVRSHNRILGTLFDVLDPPYHLLSGGCHLNRRTEDTLRSAGYTILERRSAWAGLMRWIIAAPPR
jgi:ubiquinone/menaquinone biosynthesis C-methylase UbiE